MAVWCRTVACFWARGASDDIEDCEDWEDCDDGAAAWAAKGAATRQARAEVAIRNFFIGFLHCMKVLDLYLAAMVPGPT